MHQTTLPARDGDTRYQALRSRDRRFDGVFFVGVSTTGIYCRPVCRARLPHRRNCTFFESAAQAEGAGFRPCLRCRPELAPGRSLTDAHARLARAAYVRIAESALSARSVRDVARDLCVSERQLRRAVRAEFGASPIELAQTQRLLLAKQLLTETDLPVTRVAYSSGFASLSRFNALFRARYRMSPSRLRRERRGRVAESSAVTLRFGYRPPFDWPRLLAFLGRRALAGIEYVDATSYARTLRFGEHAGWIRVRAATREDALEVTVSESLLPALLPLRTAVRRAFDLDAAPEQIAAQLGADAVLGPLVAAAPGLRLPGAVDGFEIAVRGVLGQQISVAGATTLHGRLLAAFAEPAADAPDGLRWLPLEPAVLAGADTERIASLGMPRTRARTLIAVARAAAEGTIGFDAAWPVDRLVPALLAIPGIGPWTAEYIALRALSWPDAFPASDAGVRNALGGLDARAALQLAEAWRPWRGYAVIHLWESLSRQGSA